MTITDKMAMYNNVSSVVLNPEFKPLEELKISALVNGQLLDVPGLDEHWVSQGRVFVQYFPPLLADSNDAYPLGAKEDWLERMSYFQADMKWLLGLSHHRFWSQIVIGEDSLVGVESFLQEATPFYVTKSFPHDSKMIDEYKIAQHLVFLVLIRLTTQKESEKEWIGSKKLGQLWYDKYLITLPIMLDMCLLYGHSNRAQLSKMISRVFEIQPLYNEDVKNAIVFINERLNMVQDKVSTNKPNNHHQQPMKLSDQNKSSQPVKRSEFTLLSLSDLILYVLDTAVNLTSFLSVYRPGCVLFHNFHFETRVVSVYENTIPRMCQELDLLAKKEDTIDVYFDLKFKLDLARHELLKLFRFSSYSTLNALLESSSGLSEDEIKSCVDNFISVLSEFLSDKVFIQDYNKAYPVSNDLSMLSEICPELDSVKCDFLIESVLSCYDLPKMKKPDNSSVLISGKMSNVYAGPSNLANASVKKKLRGVELQSLVSEVKDIMPHLGEGFVQKCLEYYDYKSASVINAILENSLPEPLECLDMDMAAIEEDNNEQSVEENGVPERANVFDNDEFDIMTQDYVDTSKIHKGKWKHENKSFNELLNDKSHVSQLKESYARLGIVTDEVEGIYEDEYDDTYDGVDVAVKEPGEPERRPFTTPRVLQTSSAHSRDGKGSDKEFDEDGDEDDEEELRNRDNFVENPEVVRARLAERRQQRQFYRSNRPPQTRDVVGKPKGQGQENNVVRNREFKGTHKSTYANHNRRTGAQRKRNQGMMPS